MTRELLGDLLRSAWIVEAARVEVYEAWATKDDRFEASRSRSERRAQLIAEVLGQELGRGPDRDLVAPHARWIRSLAGELPGEVAFSDLFLIRLGDWVDAHAGEFLEGRTEELRRLGEEEREGITFPTELPPPPPFEPLPPVDVEPTGELLFRFGILGDLHIGSPRAEEMARAAIGDLNASGAELVIQLGDITDHGERSEFELATRLLAELAMPFTTMLGNHDIFSRTEQRLSGREYYPQSFGREPDGILLEHKGFRFAVLDSAESGASPFAPFDLLTGTFVEGPGGAVVGGSLTPPQHELLAEVAEPKGPPGFLFLHHPPQPFTSFPPVVFGLREEDTARLHAVCDSGNVWGMFAGHTHRNARSREFDGVPSQEVAIPRDFPFGYALVDVTTAGYAYRFMQISDEALLRDAYATAGEMFRRYGRGSDDERGFVWTYRSRSPRSE